MVALGENIISDISLQLSTNAAHWVSTWIVGVTIDNYGVSRRFIAGGTPAGQARTLYSAPNVLSLMSVGRIIRLRMRAAIYPFTPLGDYSPSGQQATVGVYFWDAPHKDERSIPFGDNWADEWAPTYHDIEILHTITAEDIGHNAVFTISTRRGDRPILFEPGSLWMSIEDPAAPADEPPTAPTDLAVANPTTASLDLAWSAATDDDAVAGYNVYLYPSGGGAPTKLNTTLITATGYTATGLLPATAYAFTVTAVDTADQESAHSLPAAGATAGGGGGEPGTDEPPTAPTNLAAAATTDTTVTLQWDPATDDVWIIGYHVYAAGERLTVVPQSALTYTAAGLDPETEYSFTVTAVDTAMQESPPSAALLVTTEATPEAPPDATPWDTYAPLAADLAPAVAAYLGAAGDRADDVTAAAAANLPVVAEYVRGYTRGRGWTDYTPAGPLRAVLVAATARLVDNPDQVEFFKTGDSSERPATLAGWTLPELAVLRRYRRTTGHAGAAHADVALADYDALAADLAPRVADYLGRLTDNAARTRAVTIAATVLPMVAEYVRGYTRGRGYTGAQPDRALMAVIVAAAARVVANPEQVTYYATGDYSERPATLTGWTLPELAVLRRYRKATA